MADSNITKRALATALKDLMRTTPFEKINVGQICEKCGMNRKSFYYHFRDKYDLLNWIFDVEFLSLAAENMQADTYGSRIESLRNICRYFYDNRDFYRRALKTQGQNSFSEHFQSYIRPIIQHRLLQAFGEENADEFTADCFADACLCAIERWLTSKNCMTADEFVERLDRLIQAGAKALYAETQE